MLLAGVILCPAGAASLYPTGLIPPATELRDGLGAGIDWIAQPADMREPGFAPQSLPQAHANTLHLPAVRNQLLANCGAYAPSYYYKTYQEARERGWIRPDPNVHPERVMSPGFTYPLTSRGENSGAGLAEVMQVICRYGIATWADMPESAVWWEYPADHVWAKALPYRGERVIGFDLATDGGMAALKQHLADGDLAVFAIPVSSFFYEYPHGGGVNNGVIYTHAAITDFHALTLIGYDDTRTYHDGTGLKSGAFLAVNSWGPGWGVTQPDVGTGGFCWIGYDYMRFGRASETTALAMIDRIDYVPREWAVLDLSHASRRDMNITIAPGNGWYATNALSAFPRGGGPLPYHGVITVDVTDFMADRPEVFHLFATDLGPPHGSPETGTIRRFEVSRADGSVMNHPSLPVTLRNYNPEDPPEAWLAVLTRLKVGILEHGTRRFWTEPLPAPAFSWVDFNGNGHMDVVVFGTHDSTNHHAAVYINDGAGQFRPVAIDMPPLHSVFMAWGDYDNDGYPDLAVSGRTPAPELDPVVRLLRNDNGRGLVDSGIALAPEWVALAWGDYDQDGDLDLATSTGRLYRNDGGTAFPEAGLTVLGGNVSFRSVTWADLNNDGLLDLIVNGQINMNTGGAFGGPFHADPLNPPRVGAPGQLLDIRFWHDFSGDGLLDAVAEGRIYYDMGTATDSKDPNIWKQWYEPSKVVFPNWGWPRIDAADYNHDGYLDLALSGAAGTSADPRFSVFRQETNRYPLPHVWNTWAVDTFTDIGLRETGFNAGGVAWADWDGDGDTDLLAGGYDAGFVPYRAVLENRLADRGQPNQPPSVPQRLETTTIDANVLLRWQPSTDDVTPETELAYEVRVGRRPGGAEIVSPFGLGPMPGNARLIGAINLPEGPVIWPRFKNTAGLPGIRLRNLAPGRYYWSVRAVDGGRARSPWSAEQAFTLAADGLRIGDVNADGKVDVADLVRIRRMIAGTVPADPTVADLNADGIVDAADALIVAGLLLELGIGGFMPVAAADIGPAGGTLGDGTFALTVPPGAFPVTARLALAVTAEDGLPGYGPPSLLWRVEGLPLAMDGSLTFSAPDLRADTATSPAAFLGQWSTPFGTTADEPAPRRDISAMPAIAADGRLSVEIPSDLLRAAARSPATTDPHDLALAATAPIGTFEVDVGFGASPYLQTEHFRLYWPKNEQPDYLVALAQDLEDAFARFAAMHYDFTDKRDWSVYPVQVMIKHLDIHIPYYGPIGKDGDVVYKTDNGAYINFNINLMSHPETRRIIVNHEMFHIVQGLINPAYAITEAADSHLLLVSEATATWMERYGAVNTDMYVSSNYELHKHHVFRGLSHAVNHDATLAGYGFAGLIEYLYKMKGTPDVVRHIYTRISHFGEDPVSAILNVASPAGNHDWHHDFYHSLVEGTIYPFDPFINPGPITGTDPFVWPPPWETVVFEAGRPMRSWFLFFLAGLGGRAFRCGFTLEAYEALTDTSTLAFSIGNERGDLALNVVAGDARPRPRGTVPVESYGANPKRIRVRIPNLKQHIAMPADPARHHWRSFYPVVSRTHPAERDRQRSVRLQVAVVDQIDGPYPIPDFTHGQFWWKDENAGFPAFNITARLNLDDLTGLVSTGVVQALPGVQIGSADLLVLQDGRIPAPVYFNAVRTGGSYHDHFEPGKTNDFTRITYKSTSGYKLFKRAYGGPELEDQPYVFEPRAFSGTGTLALEADEEHVYYGISIHFTVELQVYKDGAAVGAPKPIESNTTPVFIHIQRQ